MPVRPLTPRVRRRTPTGPVLASALGIGLAVGLAGCGASDPGDLTDDAEPAAAESVGCADDDTATSTEPVSLTDDLGRTVELARPAERVVVLEWQQIEDVLSLCVSPVGVADTKGFSTWVTAEQLPDGVKDVGLRGEANLEAIYATDPDLVVVETSDPDDPLLKKLEKSGTPTLATTGADAADPIGQMRDTFSLLATATGREERAAVVLDEFDAALEEGRTAMKEADTTDFVYFDGWVDGGNVTLRPFGQGSLVGDLGEELGLTNVWTGQVDPVYGLGQTDVEGMTEVGEATLLHTGTEDPDGDFMKDLEKSKVFQGLPAVEDGRSHAFPAGIWTFGGPRSSMQVIDAYVDLLGS